MIAELDKLLATVPLDGFGDADPLMYVQVESEKVRTSHPSLSVALSTQAQPVISRSYPLSQSTPNSPIYPRL